MGFSILLALGLSAVPPPLPQRGANCSAPTYATDQLVCSDPDLRRRDAEMLGYLDADAPPTGAGIEPQEAWFRRSRLCAMREAHRACIVAAYDERIAMLRAPRLRQAMTVGCLSGAVAMLVTGQGRRFMVRTAH